MYMLLKCYIEWIIIMILSTLIQQFPNSLHLFTHRASFFDNNPQIHKTSRQSKKLRNTVPNQYKTTTITPKYHIPNMKHI